MSASWRGFASTLELIFTFLPPWTGSEEHSGGRDHNSICILSVWGRGKKYIRKIQKAVEVISRHIPLCIPFSLTSGIRELENNVNKKVIYTLVMIVLFSESSRGVHGLPEGVGAADARTV